MDTLYRLLEWNPVQVGSTFQQAQDSCPLLADCVCRILFFYCKAKTVQLALDNLKENYGAMYLPNPVCFTLSEKVIS